MYWSIAGAGKARALLRSQPPITDWGRSAAQKADSFKNACLTPERAARRLSCAAPGGSNRPMAGLRVAGNPGFARWHQQSRAKKRRLRKEIVLSKITAQLMVGEIQKLSRLLLIKLALLHRLFKKIDLELLHLILEVE